MPLIPCPDCTTDVSSKAVACPKCGAPLKTTVNNDPLDLVPNGGIALIIIGLCTVGYFFLLFATTPDIPDSLVGSGGRVYNIGLLSQQTNGLILGFGVAFIGLLMKLSHTHRQSRQ